MRIYKLTNLAQEINCAIASGEFLWFTDEHLWQHIEAETIFEFLTKHVDRRGVVSRLHPVHKLELILEWHSLRDCIEPFPRDSHLQGLCLLVGYLLEGIARRSQNKDYRLTPETCGAAVPGGDLDGLWNAKPGPQDNAS